MGYNQHNAGMHFVRFCSKYAPYDDLEYYDRLATKKKNGAAKSSKEIEETFETSATEKMTTPEKPEDGYTAQKGENSIVSQSETKSKSNNKPKKKEVGYSYKKHTSVTYGMEAIVDMKHFLGIRYTVYANIMIAALQKKVDIYRIMDECEKLSASDKYLNPSPETPVYSLQKVDRALVFLSLLAEKMQCSVYQFFISDSDFRKQFVYSFLTDLEDDQWDFNMGYNCIDEETGEAEFTINHFDYLYGMTDTIRSKVMQHMDLSITKNALGAHEYSYALSFGCLNINPDNDNDFMLKGAYIWEEEEGRLKDYTEHLIELCKKMAK